MYDTPHLLYYVSHASCLMCSILLCFTLATISCTFCIDGTDYQSPPTTVMLEPLQTSVTFQFIPVCDQSVNEGNENAMLAISVQVQDQNLIATEQPSTTNVLIIGKNF